MGSAPVRRSWGTRMSSSARRGAYVSPGLPGVRKVRQGSSSAAAVTGGAATPPPSLTPIFWYDAADATATEWPSTSGYGATLNAGGEPTPVPDAVNGQPGILLDGDEFDGFQSGHTFTDGVCVLYVALMDTTAGAYIEIDGSTSRFLLNDADTGFFTFYYDDGPSTYAEAFDLPTPSAAVLLEWQQFGDAAVVKYNGTPQTPDSTTGSTTTDAQEIEFLQIGTPGFPTTVCEFLAFDLSATAAISDARSYLAGKYGLTA